jgi:hypothetical protein
MNTKVFTNKISTIDTLDDIENSFKSGSLKSEIFESVRDFFPETYRLNHSADLIKFIQRTKEEGMEDSKWIWKKAHSNQGQGVFVIPNIKQYVERLIETECATPEIQAETIVQETSDGVKKNINTIAHKLEKSVVQKYMVNPLLINGKKFDLRMFMFISSTKPYLVMFKRGYARLSMEDYSTKNFDFENNGKFMHLTN